MDTKLNIKLPKKILMLGLGYCATAWVRYLQEKNYLEQFHWQLAASYRTNEKCSELEKLKILPLQWGSAGLNQTMAEADGLIISAAPTITNQSLSLQQPDPILAVYDDLLRQCQNSTKPKRIIYLSTTGVYGDHQGNWVDETTSPKPKNPRSILRYQTEQNWQKLGAVILRLGGIYGQGQNALYSVLTGRARLIHKKAQVFGRIHVADIANAIFLIMAHQDIKKINPNPLMGAVFNIVDDEPSPPDEVIAYACQLLEKPLPPKEDYATAPMSEMQKSFYQDNKRVKNDKAKQLLGWQLCYPNYRLGLQALLPLELANWQKNQYAS